MKKKLVLVVAIALVALMAVGCAGAAKYPEMAGDWKVRTVEAMGQELTLEKLEEVSGQEFSLALNMTADGKYTLDFNGMKQTGDYTVDGEKFAIKDGDAVIEGTYKDGVVTFEAGGTTFHLVKA